MTAAVSIGLGIAACSDINITDITKLPEDSEESGSSGQPEEPEEQPGEEPEKKAFYIEVAENHSDWSGEYLITWKSDVVYAIGGWDPYGQPASADGNDIDFMKYLTPEGIPAEKADNYRSVIEKVGEHYSILVPNVGYIGFEGSKNALYKKDSAQVHQTQNICGSFHIRTVEAYGLEMQPTHPEDYNGTSLHPVLHAIPAVRRSSPYTEGPRYPEAADREQVQNLSREQVQSPGRDPNRRIHHRRIRDRIRHQTREAATAEHIHGMNSL